MAKDVKKAQKKNIVKDKQPKKVIEHEEVVEKVEVKKVVKNEKKKNNKKGSELVVSTIKFLDDNRKAILFGVAGFLLATLLFRFIFWPDRIATLKDGRQPVVTFDGETITADDLYTSLKDKSTINVLLNEIDNTILTKKYPETDEMTQEINKQAAYVYGIYEQNNSTKENFLNDYGFTSEKEFLESLKLDYRRNKYYELYAKNLVSDDEINKYYENEVFGDVDSKHMLVKIDKNNEKGLSEADAKKLAKEIISKLDSGKTWDEVVKEYKDKITYEELGYNAFNASFEGSYLKECKDLKVGKYSKEPVKTTYGYHIIYKVAQKDKPKLDEVKDDILEILAAGIKKSDSNLLYKSLIAMREEAKIEFSDTKLGADYQKHVDNYK